MDIQNYFDELKRSQTNDIHEAKELFFLNHWIFAKSRSKMASQLSVKNIPFTYTNNDKTEIHFQLSNMEVTCNDYTYYVTVYNSLGKDVMDLKFMLYTRIELSSLLSYNAKIPQLWSEWNAIEPQVHSVCEQNFKNNRDKFIMELPTSSSLDAKHIKSKAFEKILKHKIQHWQKERRLQSSILNDFANEGLSFNKDHKTNYHFREVGEMKITYTRQAFTAIMDYKDVNAALDCELTAKSVRALESIIPFLYEQACNITDYVLKQIKLRSINKTTIENLLEAKMKELKIEYNLTPWDGKHTETYYKSHNPWYKGNYTGIELKIKCKKRRCLTFHVSYEKMEQFLKILDELPKTIETVNALPFNALVSIYGNDVKWKKSE